MQYIYAALLLHKAGKEINEDNLRKIIEAAGITPDDSRIKTIVTSLKGIDIEKALSEAAMLSAPVQSSSQTTPTQKVEEKKEEREEAAEGLAALFG